MEDQQSQYNSGNELDDSMVKMRLSSARIPKKVLDIKKLEVSATGRYDARYRDSVVVSEESDGDQS